MNDNAMALVVEVAEEKKNASEFAALEASSVAFATSESTTEYTTESAGCQAFTTPSLEEIEVVIANAARQRIQAAHRELQDTRARIERESAARELVLKAAQERVSKSQAALDGLSGERASMEERARAFLGGDELQSMLGKMHLAFNARQLELEDALAVAKSDEAEARSEIQAADVTDALELQLAEQEVEWLETAAPDVAQAVRLAASADEKLALAAGAVRVGFLRDAAILLEQARAGKADSERLAEVERALAQAKENEAARDLIARLNTNADQPGVIKRIRRLIEEAEAAGLSEKVRFAANRAMKSARVAANARFAQARPIADHLVSEGFVPVVGDGRIEAWKEMSRNGHGTAWTLDHLLVLKKERGWVTERPTIPVTSKELPPRVRHSRWFRSVNANAAP